MAGTKSLGHMKPVGGGDPVPLTKAEIIVGRRPSCDIRLDFENVSGRHCILTFSNGTWHVRDLGSTNGTKVNGNKVSREQGLMPDDELCIATHLFNIDYEPSGTFVESQQVLEEEALHAQHKTSLMELAGLDGEDRAKRPARVEPRREPSFEAPDAPPEVPVPDSLPRDFHDDPAPASLPDEDDFFKLIEEDLPGH